MITKNSNIAIVGLGVLGGSYAEALHAAGYGHLKGIDIDEETLKRAEELGWIETGSTDSSVIRDCDLVISCLYPTAFIEWVKANRDCFKPGSLLTDVTGVKRAVIGEVRKALEKNVEFIACHPMAGREYRGIHYADASRFQAANFIVVPEEDNSEEAITSMKRLAQDMKFHRITILSPEEHDRMISFLSQLTHVIAVSLMNANDNTHLSEYTGDSFRDLTRIARINEQLWPELFVLNKDYLLHDIDDFMRELSEFRDLVAAENIEAMKQKMIQSTERRARFDKVEQ